MMEDRRAGAIHSEQSAPVGGFLMAFTHKMLRISHLKEQIGSSLVALIFLLAPRVPLLLGFIFLILLLSHWQAAVTPSLFFFFFF